VATCGGSFLHTSLDDAQKQLSISKPCTWKCICNDSLADVVRVFNVFWLHDELQPVFATGQLTSGCSIHLVSNNKVKISDTASSACLQPGL